MLFIQPTLGMKLCLADVHFGSKKHAKVYVKSIVNSLIGCEVRENSEHFKLLMSLWMRSPNFVEGDCHFVIGQNSRVRLLKQLPTVV